MNLGQPSMYMQKNKFRFPHITQYIKVNSKWIEI